MTSPLDRPEAPPAPDPVDPLPADPSETLDRRSFVIRAMAAIGGLTAALVAIPVAGFASVPFFRSKAPVALVSGAVPPTLRSDTWTSAGSIDDFDVGVPRLVPLQREVTDGWVSGISDVAVYVVRETEEQVLAFDIHCTHLGCPLSFASGSGTFVCPCHGGSFDIEGDVLGGPPPKPMAQYECRVVDGEVQVGPLVVGA